MIKINYKNLPFKTNRNHISKIGAGVMIPTNMNKRVKKIQVHTLKMPKFVYHMSLTPIRRVTKNRIFYVSYDKEQAFFHLQSQLVKLHFDGAHTGFAKVYVYTLKPKRKFIRAIVFRKGYRPKTISNGFGIKYNSYGGSGINKIMTESNKGHFNNLVMTPNNINSTNFKEGSGDNMILGHLLCSKIKNLNGIRNKIDQDELAVCNPKDFFTVFDKVVLDISQGKGKLKKGTGPGTKHSRKYEYSPGQLPNTAVPNIMNIEFKRLANGTSRYVPVQNPGEKRVKETNFVNLLHKYGTSKIQTARAKQALRSLTNKKPKTFIQMLSGAIKKKQL